MLSGFIIAFSSYRLTEVGGGLKEYFRARLIRIYVPYLPIGISLYLSHLLLPGLSEAARSTSLLTTLTLLPDNEPFSLSVSWTLVHEVLFYMIFSLWFLSRRIFWLAIFLWVICILGAYACQIELSPFAAYFLSPLNLCFVFGVALCVFMRKVPVARPIAVLASFVGVCMVGLQASTSSPDRFWVAIGFGFLILSAASPAAGGDRVRRWLLSWRLAP